jgi:hypothetical protein
MAITSQTKMATISDPKDFSTACCHAQIGGECFE